MSISTLKIKQLSLVWMLLICTTFLSSQNAITWTENFTLTGTFKYIRICKVTKGPAAGELIMTYFKSDHSAPFGMRRSNDQGRTWSDETIFMSNSASYYYVNPSIIQLEDGRLMLSYCKRSKGTLPETIPNQGPCVKFSTDGGYSWGSETFIAWGGDYEPTAIQVTNDKDGDGNNDIYLFWTMDIVDESLDINTTLVGQNNRGEACGVVASYDNGKTWTNFRSTKVGARIVHRNFTEPVNGTYFKSKGNMPTPVLLPNNRIGVACEAVDKDLSPWFTVSDSGDWDWENFQNSGEKGFEYNYFGYVETNTTIDCPTCNIDDDNVYPTDRSKCWRPTFKDNTWGGAPYVCVLPNGKIAFSQNSGQKIKVFVGDVYGKNTVQQVDPWTGNNSFYSCIIPLNDHEVLVAAHDPVDNSRAFIRIGNIVKDIQAPSIPQNVRWTKIGADYQVNWSASTDNMVVHKYEVYANGDLVKTVLWNNNTLVSGLNADTNYDFTVRAMDYQGNFSQFSTDLVKVKPIENVKIYQNPANQHIQIETSFDNYSTEIIGLDGTILFESSIPVKSVTVSGLDRGMYFISIKNNGNKSIFKFIKN